MLKQIVVKCTRCVTLRLIEHHVYYLDKNNESFIRRILYRVPYNQILHITISHFDRSDLDEYIMYEVVELIVENVIQCDEIYGYPEPDQTESLHIIHAVIFVHN